MPSHYFKIFIREVDGGLESIAFIIPNSDTIPGRTATDEAKDKFLRKKIRRVREILDRTGLDLFPELVGEQRETLKAFKATGLWPTE